jgi:hypothetical protein
MPAQPQGAALVPGSPAGFLDPRNPVIRVPAVRLSSRACLLALLALASILPLPASARNGGEPLNHYALLALEDEATAGRLATRFKARGQPVFLIHDPNKGLAQGDIMRFQDKAVLVDGDVWQTLQAEGALKLLRSAPLVRLQAKASIATWESRAKLVENPREKKAYLVGAELLKILDQNFGGIPSRQQVVIAFDGPSLVMFAPAELLDQLRFTTVRKVDASGAPAMVSPAPRRAFAGRPFQWQAWAADPSEPSASLRYGLAGSLPKGLAWDAAGHALRGVPESPGRFPLTVSARNPQGASASMEFVLEVRMNEPPDLAQPPRPVALEGQAWDFRPKAVDPDHEGSGIRIAPVAMPAGMTWDSAAGTLRWIPATGLAGTAHDLVLRLEDPDRGVRESRHRIEVIPASGVLWSEGVKLDLPWDTLQQGKEYRWAAGASALAWAQQGITLVSVTGPDTTEFNGETLRFRPSSPGEHILAFAFDIGGTRSEQYVTLPVRPDLPPRFVSEVGTWRIRAGQHATYRPSAIDAEGEAVRMEVELPENGTLRWEHDRLVLETNEVGTYAARLVASDPAGHRAEQWVAFKVEKSLREPAWFLENRIQSGLSTWTATVDFGTGRLGVFTHAIERIGTVPSGRIAREWPFFFFGGNLLGPVNEARGRRLWTDVGLTMRFPDPKVLTGGFYLRLLGDWTFPGKAIGRVEFETVGHVNQGLVISDSSGIQLRMSTAIVEIAERFDRVMKDVIRAGTARDNAALFTRLEAWSRLGYGFWAGPGLWREDLPNAHRYEQRIGGGLRYQARLADAMAVNTLRVGWGAAGTGWTLYWTGRVSLGSPF